VPDTLYVDLTAGRPHERDTLRTPGGMTGTSQERSVEVEEATDTPGLARL